VGGLPTKGLGSRDWWDGYAAGYADCDQAYSEDPAHERDYFTPPESDGEAIPF